MARPFLLAVTLNVWIIVGIQAAALAVQFWRGEPPCPLCLVQRVALMLVALGPLHILLRAYTSGLTPGVAAVGQGMAIVAALLGGVASGRQILLHILPNDPGFGSPLFGLHLYTWCFVAFVCQVAASAALLIAANWIEDSHIPGPLTRFTAVSLAAVVEVNLLSVLAEAGFHWDLPGNPSGYLLFK